MIATANTTIYSQIGGSSTGRPTFSDFTNLALSRDSGGTERLSFLGITQTEAGTTQGIYQVNPALPTTTGFRLAATGDPIIPGSDARTFAMIAAQIRSAIRSTPAAMSSLPERLRERR